MRMSLFPVVPCEYRLDYEIPRKLAGVLACTVIAPVLLASCGGSEEPATESAALTPPVVEVQAAELRSIQPTITLPAVVEALESSRLRPQVSATVVERHVTPGAIVEAGELLYRFDDTQLALALTSADAALEQARASLQEAEANWERAQRLQPQGAISQQGYEAARAAQSVAQSRVAAAEANVGQAQVDLEHTVVRAPFRGRISVAQYAIGDYVTPSSVEPLAEIVRLDPIYVTAQIDQKVYFEVTQREAEQAAQGIDIQDDVSTQIRLPTGDTYAHTGRFVNWDNEGVAETGTVGARAEFPNPEGMLLPGNNVLLEAHIDEPISRVVIPQRAVAQDQQGHYVFIVGADDVVERRNISVVMRIGPDWALSEGLDEGEQVVVHGLQLVRPGITVEPRAIAASED